MKSLERNYEENEIAMDEREEGFSKSEAIYDDFSSISLIIKKKKTYESIEIKISESAQEDVKKSEKNI